MFQILSLFQRETCYHGRVRGHPRRLVDNHPLRGENLLEVNVSLYSNKAAGVLRPGYRFWVFGRAGEPCRVCGRQVTVDMVGGRKCFWCPSRQPESAGPGNEVSLP